MFLWKAAKLIVEVNNVPKRKADPSTIGLGSSETKGQGTTRRETGKYGLDSSRKKKKRS